MDKLFYDRKSKKLYVKELISEKSGDILVVHNEAYIDVTDEILGLLEDKNEPEQTEFEQFMDGVVDDTIRETYSKDGFEDICEDALELAKKEIFHHGEGTYYYSKIGDVDFIDYMPIRTPVAVPSGFYPLNPACWEPGGTCTNPHFDCINCPRKTTGGSFSTNTSSGTSTLKAEE